MAMFAPILNSSQPAFNYQTSDYNINYIIPDKVSNKDIKHIGIRVIQQNNNANVVNTSLYPDGIIYKNINTDSFIGKNQSIPINFNDLIKGHWKQDTYYKVQLRFGLNPIWTEDFFSWKEEQNKNSAFSEWSTVMVLKAIIPPKVKLSNKEKQSHTGIQIIGTENREFDSNPLFEGTYFSQGDETVSHYSFSLYKNNELIEETGWLLHDTVNDIRYSKEDGVTSGDQHRFKTSLLYNPNAPITYSVVYQIKTFNLYEAASDLYSFQLAIQQPNPSLQNVMKFEFESDNEEGLVSLWLKSKNDKDDLNLTGNYILSRTSEKSNFLLWEDIKYFNWTLEKFKGSGEIVFKDYTIESGIQYKYAIQNQNAVGIRTERYVATDIYKNQGENAQVDFQYAYLYSNGIQLKLKYDSKMGSFKRTVQASKQDTLGSQYPIIMRNAVTNYAEFPVTGLISLHADEAQNFFKLRADNKETDGYYYKNELVIPKRKLQDNYRRTQTEQTANNKQDFIGYSFDTNQTDNNYFIERIYREKVEEFLNDGGYKLYKSPTAGNFIVGLINVSLTPNEQLGKMIQSFNSTAYEIAQNIYDNIVKYGIENRGELEALSTNSFYVVGQINPLQINWDGTKNLIPLISDGIAQQQIDDLNKDLYKFAFKNLSAIWFEPFPQTELTSEINNLNSQINKLKAEGIDNTKTLEDQVKRYEIVRENLRKAPVPARLGIYLNKSNTKENAKQVYLGYNQKYNLSELNYQNEKNEPVTDWTNGYISIIPFGDYEYPMLLNYIAEVQLVENIEAVVTGVVSATAYGQVGGLFLDMNDPNQKNFYEMQNSMLEINDSTLTQGLPISLYDTLDIGKVIEKEIKTNVGNMYIKLKNLTDITSEEFFTVFLEEEHAFTNEEGNVILKILGYEALEIEADKGTVLNIINVYGDKQQIVIGPTARYTLKFVELENLQDIELTGTAQCLVNYYAQVKIEEKGVANQ